MNRSELTENVRAAQKGDKAAFERLYSAYRDRIWFFVNKNVGSEALTEDIVSETFVTAMQKLGELRQAEAFGSWLYTVAYNECRRQMNIEGQSVQFESGEQKQQFLESSRLNEPVLLPDDYAVNKDTRRRLGEIIDGLSPDQRSAIILYYYNELSIPEVAKALGTNENNTRQKLFKARSRIKKQIEKLFGSGAMLSAVPLGAMLENTADASYAKAAAGAAKVKGIGLGAKIAAVGAAAAVAVGVPLAIHRMNKKGDYRPSSVDVCFGTADTFVCPEGVLYSEAGFIHFTDLESGESTVLCSKPDCRHTDEGCCAYFETPVFEDIYGGSLYVLEDGDSLNESRLYKCSTDGSERRVLTELDADGSLGSAYVLTGNRLYCFVSNTDVLTNEMTFTPVIIDLWDGAVHKGESFGEAAFRLLYADENGMYYSTLETDFDIDEYLENGRAQELDSLYTDPESLTYSLWAYNGTETRRTEGFDSGFQAVYYDGEWVIAQRLADNTYCLADISGNTESELITAPSSVAFSMYNTAAFCDDSGHWQYYDKDKKTLIPTSSAQVPRFLYGGTAVFSRDDIASIDDWVEGRHDVSTPTEKIVLDDEYFKEHWGDRTVLYICSEYTVCDTVNAAFNDRLAELGKDYVVDFEQDTAADGAGEYIEKLSDRKQIGTPTDIFVTPALNENEDIRPYSLCIGKGLCAPLDSFLETDGQRLYKAYPETAWKCVTRGGGIYGVCGSKALSSGLCIDVREAKGDHPNEINVLSELEEFLRENSDGRPAMYLDRVFAEYIKNQNGTLVGGCIPIRLTDGEPQAFDPYSTEFFKDYIGFVYSGRKQGLIGSDPSSPIVAGNRSPKEIGTVQITISGFEDYAAPIETGVSCVASWSQNKEQAFDLLEIMSRDEKLNDLLYYGIENVSYTVGGSTVNRTENAEVFGSENTFGNELLLIENKPKAAALKAYNESLPVPGSDEAVLSAFGEDLEKYRRITEKYKAMLTGEDEQYKEHYKALLTELDAAGYGRTIAEINELLKGV